MSYVATWKVDFNHHTPKLKPLEVPSEGSSLDTVSREYLPDGAYTTFRTYEGNQALYLERHFERLEETAQLADSPVLFDHKQLRAAVRESIHQAALEESRVRITLDLKISPGTFYISLEPLKVPSPQQYQQGVKLVTVNMKRFNPKAKLTGFIAVAAKIRGELPKDLNDGLLYDKDGLLLEGMTSNFFGVKGGKLWTAEEGVLSGITRAVVLDEAVKCGLPIELRAIHRSELAQLEEVFITSASRGVLPVQQIDDIHFDAPGELTRCLWERYQARIAREIEPI